MRKADADRNCAGGLTIARTAIGFIWLAGAIFNAAVTLRLSDPFGWLADGSRFRVYRWFFADVAGAHPSLWTGLLIVGEAALGILTLARGGWAKLGLIGGALFSAFLACVLTRGRRRAAPGGGGLARESGPPGCCRPGEARPGCSCAIRGAGGTAGGRAGPRPGAV